jgi:hypothetical protein
LNWNQTGFRFSAERPRPRGQVCGHEPAREDADVPLRRHWLRFIFKDNKRRAKVSRRDAAKKSRLDPCYVSHAGIDPIGSLFQPLDYQIVE